MEDDSGERIILSCILEIPEIKRNILKYFHRNRLEDIQAVAEPVLTHRMITTFAAQSEGIDARRIVRRLVEETTPDGIAPTATGSA